MQLEEQVAALAQRLRYLEDCVEILRLVASYGPRVDSNEIHDAARMWVDDGVYDVDAGAFESAEAIEELFAGEGHQGFVTGGCGHLLSLPVIDVDGDRAVVTNYMQIILRKDDAFEIRRMGANRWELARTADGWRIVHRTNRNIDGRPEPRELLARGVRS